MTSVVGICNRALQRLGQPAITSLGDNTPASDACNLAWPFVRQTVFRDHSWNCLVARKSLAASQTTPAYEYSNEYPLPSDCLRVLQVLTGEALITNQYTVEGRSILFNGDGGLFIRYVKDEEDPVKYDSLLVEALASYMAMTLAEELTQSNTKRQLAMDEYKNTVQMAKRVDGQETPPVRWQESDWLISRRY
jgi:hypothetical protein